VYRYSGKPFDVIGLASQPTPTRNACKASISQSGQVIFGQMLSLNFAL
jgi:hypothetical protein